MRFFLTRNIFLLHISGVDEINIFFIYMQNHLLRDIHLIYFAPTNVSFQLNIKLHEILFFRLGNIAHLKMHIFTPTILSMKITSLVQQYATKCIYNTFQLATKCKI